MAEDGISTRHAEIMSTFVQALADGAWGQVGVGGPERRRSAGHERRGERRPGLGAHATYGSRGLHGDARCCELDELAALRAPIGLEPTIYGRYGNDLLIGGGIGWRRSGATVASGGDEHDVAALGLSKGLLEQTVGRPGQT